MLPNTGFDAPIPGQSLTQTPGGSKIEHPPLFVHLDDALNFTWDMMHKKKAIVKLVGMLHAGTPAEVLARTIVYQGLLKNNWTVDIGLQMMQTLVWQIEAIAKLKKIKVKTFIDDKSQDNAVLGINNILESQSKAKEAVEPVTPEQPSIFKGFF